MIWGISRCQEGAFRACSTAPSNGTSLPLQGRGQEQHPWWHVVLSVPLAAPSCSGLSALLPGISQEQS